MPLLSTTVVFSNEERGEDTPSLVSPLSMPSSTSFSPTTYFDLFHQDAPVFDDNIDDEEDEYIDNNLFCPDTELSKEEMQEYLAAPSLEKWRDHSPIDFPTLVTMDEAKGKQWKLAKDEIMHIRKSVQKLVGKEDSFKNVTKEDILFLLLGPSSKVGRLLKIELALTDEQYLKFISTICIQGGYHVSVHELFLPVSLLRDQVEMDEAEYNKIWLNFARSKKISNDSMSTSRRDQPVWASLELIVNEMFRTIAVAGREGEISIALDDDKIWLSQANAKVQDLFDLKYTTHTQANRKGIVGHTAITTGINFPLGIVFEKTFDTSVSCFKRLLNFIFRHDDNSNHHGNAFRNVFIHSDRGYMVPNLVFEYLLANGAQVVGTVKRLAGGWPFTFNQKIDKNDLRREIDTKGSPALFLKWCRTKVSGLAGGSRRLFASAFRSGTNRVATAISSIHTHHQWEGVVHDNRELVSYKEDTTSLRRIFFKRVDRLFQKRESEEEKAMMKQLLDEKIDPLTLRQGK